ncbi:Narbonolide/10-deoxymethynolide synthase PikA3, module 5 [Streptomyces fumanus]
MARLIAGIDADPLRSVVHAAGVGQAGALLDTDLAEAARVAAGKAAGARNLDAVLGDRPLDAFVLFSSIAGVWGSGRQAVYAYANACLDALAEHRRSRGLTATALAWGPWAGAGMTDDDGARAALTGRGLGLLDPDTAVAALRRALELDETTVTVADIDWERFLTGFTALRPSALFDALPEARHTQDTQAPARPPPPASPPARRPSPTSTGPWKRCCAPRATPRASGSPASTSSSPCCGP